MENIYTLYKGEENRIPVAILDVAGSPVTDLPYTAANVYYSRHSDTGMTAFVLDSTRWKERGHGMYALIMPGTVFSEEGMFIYTVEPVSTANQTVRGAAYVDRRMEARLLEAPATGYDYPEVGAVLEAAGDPSTLLEAPVSGYDEGTVGRVLEDAGNRYEVFCCPAYDYEAGILKFRVWLHRNGLLVDDPTSCEVKLTDENGDVVADSVSSSPEADGFFTIIRDPQDPPLEGKATYKVSARVTHDGTDYTSGETHMTLS